MKPPSEISDEAGGQPPFQMKVTITWGVSRIKIFLGWPGYRPAGDGGGPIVMSAGGGGGGGGVNYLEIFHGEELFAKTVDGGGGGATSRFNSRERCDAITVMRCDAIAMSDGGGGDRNIRIIACRLLVRGGPQGGRTQTVGGHWPPQAPPLAPPLYTTTQTF